MALSYAAMASVVKSRARLEKDRVGGIYHHVRTLWPPPASCTTCCIFCGFPSDFIAVPLHVTREYSSRRCSSRCLRLPWALGPPRLAGLICRHSACNCCWIPGVPLETFHFLLAGPVPLLPIPRRLS